MDALLQPAVLSIVDKGTFDLTLLVDADLVECGENLSISTPHNDSPILTQEVSVPLLMGVWGGMVVMKKLLLPPLLFLASKRLSSLLILSKIMSDT